MATSSSTTKTGKNSLSSWIQGQEQPTDNKTLSQSDTPTSLDSSTQFGTTPPLNDLPANLKRSTTNSLANISRPSSTSGVSETASSICSDQPNNNNNNNSMNTPQVSTARNPSSLIENNNKEGQELHERSTTPEDSALNAQLQAIASGGDPDVDTLPRDHHHHDGDGAVDGDGNDDDDDDDSSSEYDTPPSTTSSIEGVGRGGSRVTPVKLSTIDAAQQGFVSGTATPPSPVSPALPSSLTETTTKPATTTATAKPNNNTNNNIRSGGAGGSNNKATRRPPPLTLPLNPETTSLGPPTTTTAAGGGSGVLPTPSFGGYRPPPLSLPPAQFVLTPSPMNPMMYGPPGNVGSGPIPPPPSNAAAGSIGSSSSSSTSMGNNTNKRSSQNNSIRYQQQQPGGGGMAPYRYNLNKGGNHGSNPNLNLMPIAYMPPPPTTGNPNTTTTANVNATTGTAATGMYPSHHHHHHGMAGVAAAGGGYTLVPSGTAHDGTAQYLVPYPPQYAVPVLQQPPPHGGIGDPAVPPVVPHTGTARADGRNHHNRNNNNHHSSSTVAMQQQQQQQQYQQQYQEMLAYMQGYTLQYHQYPQVIPPTPHQQAYHAQHGGPSHHHVLPGGYSTGMGGMGSDGYQYSGTGRSDGGYSQQHQYQHSKGSPRRYSMDRSNDRHHQHPDNTTTSTEGGAGPHSSLLEEYKSWREHYGENFGAGGRQWTINDIQGHLYSFCRDQYGSRLVQHALTHDTRAVVSAAFTEIQEKLSTLMMDVFANYVVQKFLEVGDKDIIATIGRAIQGRVVQLSLHTYGCRVVQKALEAIENEQRILLCSELQPQTLRCVQDQNGNHVVQKCIECIHPSDSMLPMLQTIHENAIQLSMHTFGCRLVQRLLEYCTVEELVESTIGEILTSVLMLAHDQYGNYVVQHLVEKGPEETKKAIYSRIAPQAPVMSQHKYASNVVEGCLKHGTPTQRAIILDHIIAAGKASNNTTNTTGTNNTGTTTTETTTPVNEDDNDSTTVGTTTPNTGADGTASGTTTTARGIGIEVLARHKYGNYVVQRALLVAQGQQKQELMMLLQGHVDGMKKYSHAKHVAQRVENMLAEAVISSGSSTGVVDTE